MSLRSKRDQLRLRRAVRALIIDPSNRTLLVRFQFPGWEGWATPGGGIDAEEDPVAALRRELAEEVGRAEAEIGPLIWRRTHVFPFLDGSYDGQVENVYLVQSAPFEPTPRLSREELRREYVTDMRWWSLAELEGSEEEFAPRRLPELVRRLIEEGPPQAPIDVEI